MSQSWADKCRSTKSSRQTHLIQNSLKVEYTYIEHKNEQKQNEKESQIPLSIRYEKELGSDEDMIIGNDKTVSNLKLLPRKKKYKEWIHLFDMPTSYHSFPFQLVSWNEKLYAVILNKQLTLKCMEYTDLPDYTRNSEPINGSYKYRSLRYSINRKEGKLFVIIDTSHGKKKQYTLFIYDLNSFHTDTIYILGNNYGKIHALITCDDIEIEKKKNI
eukprot:66768_1